MVLTVYTKTHPENDLIAVWTKSVEVQYFDTLWYAR